MSSSAAQQEKNSSDVPQTTPLLNDSDFLTHHGGTPDDPLHKQGIPLWVFSFLTHCLWLFPLDAYVVFPILLLLLISGLSIFVALGRANESGVLLWVMVGAGAALILWLWLSWVRKHPRVPQEDDVARFSLREGHTSWPKAPVAPLRGELVAKGSSWFKDQQGRRLLLRGINLAGGSKLPREPMEERGTHLKATPDFFNFKGVSFVGRPFPLEEADLHLGRLRAMGLTFLRFLVTWEAVEHDGPGIYDEAYLTYLKAVIQRCGDFGISVFIDFHQDVWSRWTGGDGAPAWTLEKVGFALDKLHSSGAALTQQHWNDGHGEYPKMVWNSNNARLAAGTMWTLFFAGDDFAPRTKVDDEPVQQYLQRHFCAAIEKVAQVLKDEPNVVGFDLLNEPSVGFVRVQDVRDIGPNQYYVGWRVDPWTAMKLGAGKTCSVDYFSSFMVLEGKRDLNAGQVCAWQNGPTSCVWHQNGVWELNESTGEPRVLKPKFFATNPRTGQAINFLDDYSLPFVKRAAKAVRKHMPDAIIFAEPVLDMTEPTLTESPVLTADEVGGGYVWAKHYYDGITLMTKSFSRYLGLDPVTSSVSIGMKAIQLRYGEGIMKYKEEASNLGPGGCPVLIGEVGIPFDLGHASKACGRRRTGPLAFGDGDFSRNTLALNTSMRALEHAKVSYTIWTYEADNTNEFGDNWNGEDLSLFSRDQVEPGDEDNLFAGGRSLIAAIRPYPCRVAGDILGHSFHLYRQKRTFVLVFIPDHSLTTRETTMFVPNYQYPHGIHVHIVEGEGTYEMDWDMQTLTFTHSEASAKVQITVTKVLGRGVLGGRTTSLGGTLVPPSSSLIGLGERVETAAIQSPDSAVHNL